MIDFRRTRASTTPSTTRNGNLPLRPFAETRQAYARLPPRSRRPSAPAHAGTQAAAAKKNEGMWASGSLPTPTPPATPCRLERTCLLLADAVRWLGGEESFAGAISSTGGRPDRAHQAEGPRLVYGSIFVRRRSSSASGLHFTRAACSRSKKAASGRRAPPQAARVPGEGCPHDGSRSLGSPRAARRFDGGLPLGLDAGSRSSRRPRPSLPP